MYYLLYEITNLINGKTYIGQHITKNINDGYMGSGHAITAAIKKHGKENFKKEILLNAKSEVALNFFENALVTPEFIELDTNYNLREGGGSKGSPSKATRAKLSAARKGKKLTSEHKAKLSAAKKGKKKPPRTLEHRANLSVAHKGRKRPPVSPETKAKLSAIRKGKKKSPEHIAKISAAKMGKKLPSRTPEQIANMSLYLKGIKKSPLSSEHKAKISATKRGRKLPPETRAKMSETHKRIWESRKIAAL